MAIGKSQVQINTNKVNISFGENKVVEKGELSKEYNEVELKEFMKNEKIDLKIDLKMGSKKFIAYTMDLTKKYIDINADYRS